MQRSSCSTSRHQDDLPPLFSAKLKQDPRHQPCRATSHAMISISVSARTKALVCISPAFKNPPSHHQSVCSTTCSSPLRQNLLHPNCWNFHGSLHDLPIVLLGSVGGNEEQEPRGQSGAANACHEVGEQWRTDARRTLVLRNNRSEKGGNMRRGAFAVPACMNDWFGEGEIQFSTVCAYDGWFGASSLDSVPQLQMASACTTAFRKRLEKS